MLVGATQLEQEDFVSVGLKFLWLEVTRKCNLKCVHCYEESNPRLPLRGSMTTDDWLWVLEEASKIGVEMVQFIGGEPTLFPELVLLIETARRLHMNVEVYTNGTRNKEDLWATFVRNNVALAFSYYSLDAQEHDAVTTRFGSHTKTRAAIVRALALGLTIRVGVIQMPETTDEAVSRTLDELKRLGVKNVGFDRTRGIGRGALKLSTIHNAFGELCGSCGNEKLAIDNNGNVYPCVFSKFHPIGHARDGLQNLIQGEGLCTFREKVEEQRLACRLKIGHSPLAIVASCGPDGLCVPDRNCSPSRGGPCWPEKACQPQKECSP